MTGQTRGRVIAYMVALFVAGGVTAAAVMSHMSPAQPQTLKLGRADEIANLIGDKLNDRLNLTAEQREKFKPLIKHTGEELEASHSQCLKRISAAIDTLHSEIAPDLTADQKEKLKQFEAERVDNMLKKYNYVLDIARTNAP
jgi:hypothetical protein